MEDNIKGYINRDVLSSSETEDYRIPMEPDADDDVLLCTWTAKGNVDHVYHVEDKAEAKMAKTRSDELSDYYEYKITVGTDQVLYRFRVVSEQDACLYNRLGPTQNDQSHFDFKITPGLHTPEWARGVAVCQISVDHFCNGDESNDVESYEYAYIGRPVQKVTEWDRYPAVMDVGYFYGGDPQRIWDKLDYIKRLGVGVIYPNPIFVPPFNHKYDCQDYEHIGPHFTRIEKDGGGLIRPDVTDNREADRHVQHSAGKENLEASGAFFVRFVEEVHKRGMRVILGGVFNHCGPFNKRLDAEGTHGHSGDYEVGVYESKNSPYHNFFQFHDDSDRAWPYNRMYDGQWGYDTLPKLNYENSEKLVEYILNVARKWVSPPYSIDGRRLGVAVDLEHMAEYSHEFWRRFRQAVKKANSEALILAEHYGDSVSWLEGNQWDSIMNYDAFMEPVTWFLTGMEKHSDSYNGGIWGDGEAFFNVMGYHMSHVQTNMVMTAMNQLSNHDHPRSLTRTNQMVGHIQIAGPEKAGHNIKPCVFREAAVIQMTWPEAPTLYYGDEAGVCGWMGPDSRHTYPWGKEGLELTEFHRYMIGIHRKTPVFRKGTVKPLLARYQKIAYGRTYGKYQAVAVISNSPGSQTTDILVWQLGTTDDMALGKPILTTETGYNAGVMLHCIKDGNLKLNMPSYGTAMFVSRLDEFYSVAGSRFADDAASTEEKQVER